MRSSGEPASSARAPPTPRTAGVAMVPADPQDDVSDIASVVGSSTALVVADESVVPATTAGPEKVEDVRVPLPAPAHTQQGEFMGMRISCAPSVPALGDDLGFEIGSAEIVHGQRHPGAGVGLGGQHDLVGSTADEARQSTPNRRRSSVVGSAGRRRSQGQWLPNGKRGDTGTAAGEQARGVVGLGADGAAAGAAPLSQTSMSGIAREVLEHDFDEDEWNERCVAGGRCVCMWLCGGD